MKIGIITFHCAHNYGAVLQAYALQEQLVDLGYDVEVINYRPQILTLGYERSIFWYRPYKKIVRQMLSFVKMIMSVVVRNITQPQMRSIINERRKGFSSFINNKLRLSEKTYKKSFSKQLDYDCYIIGSDQVWNISITNGFDPVFWGNFDMKKGSKIISYAASMSNYNLTDEQKNEMKTLLSKFSAISVREKDVEDFLLDLDVKSNVVFDPTLLVKNDTWIKIANTPQTKDKYVLVYTMGLLNDELRIANKIAQQIGASVEVLIGDEKSFNKKYPLISASPEEFLGYFQNASFVVTSSFHGTSFSISFNKPFYSLARGNDKDSRQSTLLMNLGLEDRFINKDDAPGYKDIDYTIVNQKWNNLQEVSLNFLSSQL